MAPLLSPTTEEVWHTTAFVGEGYGIPTREGMKALLMMARLEGILLDPVYTAKAFAAVLAMARQGRLTSQHTLLFIHTGGLPALFAYQPALLPWLGGEKGEERAKAAESASP